MAVIAINQQLGSGGIELGKLAAAQLGYRFITTAEIAAEAARHFSVDAELLKVIDERLPNFWERMRIDMGRLTAFYRAVALKEMAAGRTVVVGRFIALHIPEGSAGLRVRTVAAFAERVNRTAAEEKLERFAAERRVRDSDRELRARAQALYAVDIDDPALYTLVVNTQAIPMAALAATLSACAEQADRLCPEGLPRIRDAAIAARVRAALAAHPKIGGAQVRVNCTGAAVRIAGAGLVPPWDELVIEVARTIEGVASVEVTCEEPPIPPRS